MYKCILFFIIVILLEIILYISIFLRDSISKNFPSNNLENIKQLEELQRLYPYYLWRIFILKAIMKQSPIGFITPIVIIFLIPTFLIFIPLPPSKFYEHIDITMFILWFASFAEFFQKLFRAELKFISMKPEEKDNR